WGHLFREYTDINEAENDPARYQRKHWRIRIDGIEGYAAYLTPMHRYLYNHLHIGNATLLLNKLPRYDLIFLGDVIEHLEKAAGLRLLRNAVKKANKAVLVTTPKFDTGQADVRRLQKCRDALLRLIPRAVPFILVDDDQMRSDLPHARAIPFLEKNGEYWGPPADDATAIRELERLRRT